MSERKITRVESHNLGLPRKLNVAICARVSSHKASQDNSIETQTNGLYEMIDATPKWWLHKVYIERGSGKDVAHRGALGEMLYDCRDGKIDIILTKSIGRFGRNTVDTLSILRDLDARGINVYFILENIWLKDKSKNFVLEIMAGIAQNESFDRSENIRWGIEKSIKNGDSKLYKRKCYGYTHDSSGNLIIDDEQAEVVRLIYSLYLDGHSVISIIRELEKRGIKSPMGKDKWAKRAIEVALENEKYIGNVALGKTFSEGEYPTIKRKLNRGQKKMYQMDNAHDAIISVEQFQAVQAERQRRTNVEVIDGVRKRKDTHYSGKK